MRRHFWLSATRAAGGSASPRNTFLNCTIPEFVNISFASPTGTIGALGTMRWPFERKKSRKDLRTSVPVIQPSRDTRKRPASHAPDRRDIRVREGGGTGGF